MGQFVATEACAKVGGPTIRPIIALNTVWHRHQTSGAIRMLTYPSRSFSKPAEKPIPAGKPVMLAIKREHYGRRAAYDSTSLNRAPIP